MHILSQYDMNAFPTQSCLFQGKERRPANCNGRPNEAGSGPEKSKRPFQNVEKTCSITMAILFIVFNILYWPWLLSDDDFDYAKFEV